MFDHLSEKEKLDLKESMRLFRNPFEGEKPLGEKYYNGSRNNPFRKVNLQLILSHYVCAHLFCTQN